MVMVVPGGTVVVSIVRTIVLGGGDGGGQGTVVGRVVNEMMKQFAYICTVGTCVIPAGLIVTIVHVMLL